MHFLNRYYKNNIMEDAWIFFLPFSGVTDWIEETMVQ